VVVEGGKEEVEKRERKKRIGLKDRLKNEHFRSLLASMNGL